MRGGKVKRINLKKLEKMYGGVLDREVEVKILALNEDGKWEWVKTKKHVGRGFWSCGIRLSI